MKVHSITIGINEETCSVLQILDFQRMFEVTDGLRNEIPGITFSSANPRPSAFACCEGVSLYLKSAMCYEEAIRSIPATIDRLARVHHLNFGVNEVRITYRDEMHNPITMVKMAVNG
jgi:hypothetical protein